MWNVPMTEVHSPMFISSRLMAAVKIEGAGTVHIRAQSTRTDDGRVAYRCVIEDTGNNVLYEGEGIRSGVGVDVDYSDAMGSTLAFIEHDGEMFRYGNGEHNGDNWGFNHAVAEWAAQWSDEIGLARMEIEGDDEENNDR